MSLRNNIAFRVFGFTLMGLAIASFVARVLFMVTHGNGAKEYVSGKGVVWTYSSALAVVGVVAVLLLFVGCYRLWQRYRDR